MENIIYPLLYFELKNKQVLGILAGTDYQVVDTDLKSVKATLSSFLQRNYKKHDSYPSSSLEDFRMKKFEIKVRPTHRAEGRSYPTSTSIKVPVYAVYGVTHQGYYECFLPLFEERFYYYDPKLLNALVQNFATNYLNRCTPNDIYKFLVNPPPQLDKITLRVNPNRNYGFSNGWNFNRTFKHLESMAERYPYSKAVKRNISIFPDVAWELEHKVLEVQEKLVNAHANVLIVGKRGVGKSAVLKQTIKKIAHKNSGFNYTFWQLMSQRITAQAKYLGEWQENVELLIEDLEAANGILWVVDIIQLMRTGGDGPEDSIAAFITNYLQAGKLQLVGETTPTELESMRRMLPGFVENFQIVNIEELPEKKIFSILDKFMEYSRSTLKLNMERSAVEITYRFLLRYYPYESFPGKAIKFLCQCIDDARSKEREEILKDHAVKNFIKQTGMPELFLRDDILLDTQELHQFFSDRIVGQENAIKTLSNVVKIFKAGLNNPAKPISTMIFAGPTGVGKTACTKALASYFFGKGQSKSPLVRIDMSEFQHAGHLARFIGAGGEVGKLVQEVRERPFSVLLLDEIEKADPSVFDALLSVLDEGLLVDSYGRITNFRNTIIIMTSNIGASSRASISFGDGNNTNYESAIDKFFRPEFVNRIDHVVTFNSLSKDDIYKITHYELKALEKREGIHKLDLKLHFDPEVYSYLAEIGFDERYGARPLQRAIEAEIISPVAKWLLDRPFAKNGFLDIKYKNNLLEISFKKEL